jgi:hypothetical protein
MGSASRDSAGVGLHPCASGKTGRYAKHHGRSADTRTANRRAKPTPSQRTLPPGRLPLGSLRPLVTRKTSSTLEEEVSAGFGAFPVPMESAPPGIARRPRLLSNLRLRAFGRGDRAATDRTSIALGSCEGFLAHPAHLLLVCHKNRIEEAPHVQELNRPTAICDTR